MKYVEVTQRALLERSALAREVLLNQIVVTEPSCENS